MTGTYTRISNSVIGMAGLLIASLLLTDGIRAQCPNDNILHGAAITIPCPGTYSPTPCLRGGRYLLVNVTNGRTYTFATCGGILFDTYLTLVNNSGGAVLAFNDDACGTQSSVTWTATFTGQVRLLLDQGAGCGATTSCTAIHISCNTAAPANDLICGATNLVVNPTCVNLVPAPTNVRATVSPAPPAVPGCASFAGGDVWFRLTVPAGGNVTITTRSISSSALIDAGMEAFTSSDNTCTGVLTSIGCNDDIDFPYNEMAELVLTGLTPGNTIFLRVWEADNNLYGRFNICARVTPPLPDNICQAIAVNVGTFCEYENYTNATATTTTPPAAPSCGSFAGAMDVWYRFTAPANGRVVIQTDDGTLTDACMALYSSSDGTCSGTFTQVACNDDYITLMPYLFTTGLTPGTTYWLRVWGFAGASGTYQLCLFSPTGTRVEDCLGSSTVCDDQQVENANIYTGEVVDLVGGGSSNRGCLSSNERQGTWYAFSIATAGQLGMIISPLANDDYDWAIWGPYASGSTTSGICRPTAPPIRCTYASGGSTFGATGSYDTGMGHPVYNAPTVYGAPTTCGPCSEGSGGDGWVRGLNVTAGEVYLLYVSNFSVSGSAFNLSWTFGGGASLACTVLPVEWTGFAAEAIEETVALKWSTASERNSDYFVVERSFNAVNWSAIGTVEAAGDSQHHIDYAFVDFSPSQGANYYRLKQVDRDGAYEHTPTVVVYMGIKDEIPTVFPNPVQDILNVAFTMPVSGTVYMQIIDATGRVVRDRDTDLDRGPNTVSMGTSGLPAGAYSLRLFSPGQPVPRSVHFLKE